MINSAYERWRIRERSKSMETTSSNSNTEIKGRIRD